MKFFDQSSSLKRASLFSGVATGPGIESHQLHPARLPQAHVVEPQVHREAGEARRIRRHARIEVHERLGDAHFVAHRGGHVLRLALGELADDLGGALGHLLRHLAELLRFFAVSWLHIS
jgi:hypothetical protein